MAKKVDQDTQNRASHEGYLQHWQREKKAAGQWLSKADYERQTGRAGRK